MSAPCVTSRESGEEAVKRQLLVIACSATKRPDPEPLPALERYMGSTYRTIRRIKARGEWPETVDLLILSAEFGLIGPDEQIPNYDRMMTVNRATRLSRRVGERLRAQLARAEYEEIFVDLGLMYQLALPEKVETLGPRVRFAEGRIGEKHHQLIEWLQSLSRQGNADEDG